MNELVKVAPNTYYIESSSIIGVYVTDIFNGDVVFIDSGASEALAKHALEVLKNHNWTLKAIYHTHSHADHIAGSSWLQEATGCHVYAYGVECDFVNHTILEPIYLYGAYPHRHLRSRFLMAKPCHCEPLTQNVLPEGFEICSLPGHAMDMIAIKTPDSIWFMGDIGVSHEVLQKCPVTFLYNVESFLSSLDKAERLHGAYFIPSHMAPMENLHALLDLNRRAVASISELVCAICRTPSDTETIVSQVFERLGIAINLTQHSLVGSTIRSYLSYLADKQILKVNNYGSQTLWSLPEMNRQEAAEAEVELHGCDLSSDDHDDEDGAATLIKAARTFEAPTPIKAARTFEAPTPASLSSLLIMTDRLILRPIDFCFTEAIFKFFTPEIVRYMIPAASRTREDAREFVSSCVTALQQGTSLQMAVLDRETCEFYGGCCLNNINTPYPEIGIWIKSDAQHCSFGLEAVTGLTEWARAKLKFRYLVYPVDVKNVPSCRIPKALGGKICRRYKERSVSGIELDVAEYRIYS